MVWRLCKFINDEGLNVIVIKVYEWFFVDYCVGLLKMLFSSKMGMLII